MTYSKSNIRAFAVCAVLLIAFAIMRWAYTHFSSESQVELSKAELDSLRNFEAQLKKDSADDVALRNRKTELFPFDPNHADSATLARIGLRSWQIRNLMAYRKTGALWKSAEHFSHLYGLSPEDFERLKPYIRINPAEVAESKERWREEHDYYGAPKGEIPQYEKIDKYENGTIVDLNTADTTMLKKIPGIGSYYATKIVRARERYGGFYSTSQLSEIEGLPAGVARWFAVDKTFKVHTTSINKATFKELCRHPYVGYERAKVISNHIHNYGPLRASRELRLYKEFSEDDLRRISIYFTFD